MESQTRIGPIGSLASRGIEQSRPVRLTLRSCSRLRDLARFVFPPLCRVSRRCRLYYRRLAFDSVVRPELRTAMHPGNEQRNSPPFGAPTRSDDPRGSVYSQRFVRIVIRHRLNGATFTSGSPVRETIGGRVRPHEPFRERVCGIPSPHEPHGLSRSRFTRTTPESPSDPDSKSETLADRQATRYPATGYVESPFLSNRACARASFIARAPARGGGSVHTRARTRGSP